MSTEPAHVGSDSQQTGWWDATLGKYVIYVRNDGFDISDSDGPVRIFVAFSRGVLRGKCPQVCVCYKALETVPKLTAVRRPLRHHQPLQLV